MRQAKLDNSIMKLETKINMCQNQIKELQEQTEKLKNLKWQYSVGEIVLLNYNLRPVKIIKLLDNNKLGYLYSGCFADIPLNEHNLMSLTNEDIIKYPKENDDLIKLLRNRINELLINERDVAWQLHHDLGVQRGDLWK